MPATRLPARPPAGAPGEPSPWAARFSHGGESAAPGHYRVRVAPPGGGGAVGVDLAAGTRAAIGRFSYSAYSSYSADPAIGQALLVFDAGRRADGARRAHVHVDAATGEVTGSVTSRTFCGRPTASTLYFAARPDDSEQGEGSTAGQLRIDDRPDRPVCLTRPQRHQSAVTPD